MFKKIGAQLVQGAKAELNENETLENAGAKLVQGAKVEFNKNSDILKWVDIGFKVLEAGLLIFLAFSGTKRQTTDRPIVINNYIVKGE